MATVLISALVHTTDTRKMATSTQKAPAAVHGRSPTGTQSCNSARSSNGHSHRHRCSSNNKQQQATPELLRLPATTAAILLPRFFGGASCRVAAELLDGSTEHTGYSSVGRASDCRTCRDQMVPGSIPGGRTYRNVVSKQGKACATLLLLLLRLPGKTSGSRLLFIFSFSLGPKMHAKTFLADPGLAVKVLSVYKHTPMHGRGHHRSKNKFKSDIARPTDKQAC